MSIPKIDPYPPAPTPEDSEEVFDDKAYAHAASLELRRVQMNEVASYVNTRASDANNRATASASSATASANSATRADEWANKAPGSVVASGKYSARHYSDLSDRFANAPEDVEVAPGKYSAQHYMEKAKKIAEVHATTVETDPLPTVIATNVQEALRDLAYQADQLRVAKNQLKYGDGPYPVLDFQFAGAKYLDPRIQFTRASLDWDENGREYGIDEPVLTDRGLWTSGARTNLIVGNSTGSGWTISRGALSRTGEWHVITPDSTNSYVSTGTLSLLPSTSYCFSLKIKKGFSGRRLMRLHPNGFGEYKSLALNADGSFSLLGSGATGGVIDFSDHYYAYISAKTIENPPPSACFVWDERGDDVTHFKDDQCEIGEFPTSYIPTEGSQVTVAPSFQSVPKQLKGDYTVFVDFTPIAPTTGGSGITGIFSIFKSSTNTIAVTLFEENLRLTFYGQGLSQRSFTNFVYGQRYKIAITLRDDKVWFFINGEMILADHGLTNSIINDFNTLVLGSHIPTATTTKGATFFHAVSVFDKNLTDEQLQELTS